MSMEAITHLFSFVCGQTRSFYVDGVALPVDQRCLGLYLGALATALWLAGTGLWRRGLPPGSVLLVHAALLVAAMLGGLHVIDPGPLWRLLCGLWTGHVVVFWLVGAGVALRARARSEVPAPLSWDAPETFQALLAPTALAGIAALFPHVLPIGWYFWAIGAMAGAVVLFTAVLVAAVVTVVPTRRREARIPSAFGSSD